MATISTSTPYPAEVRERAVRLVREHESEHASLAAATRSAAAKIGCSAEILRLWVRCAGHDAGRRTRAAW
jgi:transposase